MPIEPVTLTEVATVTVVAPTLKRDVAKVWPMRRDHPEYNVGERAVTTIPGTCPATKAPTAVPTYASACSGTARYSSACSCIGVTGKTTTLPVTTVTVTKTDTASVTPTNTVTATIVHGNTATVVVASTTVIDVTVTTTVFVTQEMDTTATVVLPITETIDVTLTETDIITAIPPPPPPTVIPPPPPPTAAPAPPIPTNFVIQAQSGPSNGLYFASSSNTADSTGFTPDAGSGTVYTIQPNRYLTVLSSGLIVNTDLLGQQHQHVHTNTKADIHASGFAALICSIEPTTLTLSCEAERSPGQNSFYSCPLDAGTAPFVGHLGVSTNGCIGFTAKVVAA
ncbi:hypothetical protein MMC25_003058 [Agyrium rufum]|nr:hypothetical protein [Agyrium rufum]